MILSAELLLLLKVTRQVYKQLKALWPFVDYKSSQADLIPFWSVGIYSVSVISRNGILLSEK